MKQGPQRVLFLCSANSIRSPLAEGLWRSRVEGADVCSAGAVGKGALHPMVEQTLSGYGVSLDDFRSQSVRDIKGQRFDVVITLSEEAQRVFPEYPGAGATLHWTMPDPLMLPGDRHENFNTLAEMLLQRIEEYLRDSAD